MPTTLFEKMLKALENNDNVIDFAIIDGYSGFVEGEKKLLAMIPFLLTEKEAGIRRIARGDVVVVTARTGDLIVAAISTPSDNVVAVIQARP